MRGYAFLLATTLTLGYGFAAQAGISGDRSATPRRVTDAVTERVWYGGTLAPITVEAPREVERAKITKKAAEGRCTVA